MKFVVLIAVALGAGTLAMIAVPPTLSAASHELRQVRLSDLNPLRAIYNQQRNRAGMTREEPGIHASSLRSKPVKLAPPASLKLDLGRAFETQAETPIQQNDRRMRNLQAYAREPSQWTGRSPN